MTTVLALHAVHTCPVLEHLRSGRRAPAVVEVPAGAFREMRVVGWCNVLDMTIHGERHLLLAVDAGVA